jgi:hypothetical protein
MFIIPITSDDVKGIKKVKTWIKSLGKLSFSENIDTQEIELICQFGFFVPKNQNNISGFQQQFELTSQMKFWERFQYELSKVRVNLILKSGYTTISDRLPKSVIPDPILDIVRELTKVKMILECEFHENMEVKNSIPEIDQSIVKFDIFSDIAKSELPANLSVDDILDKILENGIDSLTKDEKEYLKRSSED